jgi:hypothetical protein
VNADADDPDASPFAWQPLPADPNAPLAFSSGSDYCLPVPTATPVPRDVAPEAAEFHAHAQEFGLPLPFDLLPVPPEFIQWTQGYGPNTYSWTRKDMTTYSQTHGYHTGIDFAGAEDTGISVRAVCDGVILSGRVPGNNGGTTRVNTGRGFNLRCFMDDPTLTDFDQDGHRNLSNIVVSYNHLVEMPGIPFPQPGQIVHEGQWLAQSTAFYSCPPDAGCTISAYGTICTINGLDCPENLKYRNHLHLEVWIARGFRDGLRLGVGGDGNDAVRINPSLMFSSSADSSISNPELIGSYYPRRVNYICLGCVEILEEPPPDFNDTDDVDFGISDGRLTQWTPSADLALPESSRGLFWTRVNDSGTTTITGVQQIVNESVEWTTSSFPTIGTLVQHLFSDVTYIPGEILYSATGAVPYCSNVTLENGNSLPDELCGGDANVTNDDADLDIGFIGTR